MVSGKTVSLRVFSVLLKGTVVWTVEFTICTTISGWVVKGGAFGFAHSRFDKKCRNCGHDNTDMASQRTVPVHLFAERTSQVNCWTMTIISREREEVVKKTRTNV